MVHQNANKGGTAQALLRPFGRERLFYFVDFGFMPREVTE